MLSLFACPSCKTVIYIKNDSDWFYLDGSVRGLLCHTCGDIYTKEYWIAVM